MPLRSKKPLNPPKPLYHPLSPKERLEIYDLLREAHKKIKEIIGTYPLEAWDKNAIDAVHSTLYLAESEFAKAE